MRWDKVKDDSYYLARQFEYMAKRYERFNDLEKAIDCWRNYSELKERKGSYFLSFFGSMQASRLYGALGRDTMAKEALQRAVGLEGGNCFQDDYDVYFKAFELEQEGNLRESINAYESLAERFIEKENYFLAADAYEHAAENRHKMGIPVKDYALPQIAWKVNSKYWMDLGEEDDSKWSDERKKYFDKLYRE